MESSKDILLSNGQRMPLVGLGTFSLKDKDSIVNAIVNLGYRHLDTAYFYANEQFHAAIYTGSHNQFLSEQAQQLHRRLRPYRRLQLRVRDRMGSSYTEHAAIVQAITSGDPQAASAALHGHIVVQGERFGDLLASLGDLTASTA